MIMNKKRFSLKIMCMQIKISCHRREQVLTDKNSCIQMRISKCKKKLGKK